MSRRFHEAPLREIPPPAGAPALCHLERSGYQQFPLVHRLSLIDGPSLCALDVAGNLFFAFCDVVEQAV
jgi:hypothetical protein